MIWHAVIVHVESCAAVSPQYYWQVKARGEDRCSVVFEAAG